MTKEEYAEIMEKYQNKFALQTFMLEAQVSRLNSENIYTLADCKTGYELYKAVENQKEWLECPYVYVIARFLNYTEKQKHELLNNIMLRRENFDDGTDDVHKVCIEFGGELC